MHKNIKWADRELPGLSHEDLLKLNSSKLGQIEGGKITGNIHYKNGTGIFSLDPEVRSELSKQSAIKANETNKANGTAVYGLTFEERSLNGKKGNETNKANSTALYSMTFEERSKLGKSNIKKVLDNGNHASVQLKKKALEKYLEVLNDLPDTFTQKQVAKALENKGIKAHNTGSFLKIDQIELIYKGRSGSKYHVNIYKKKQNI